MVGADPRDPRIVEVLNEIGANDNNRHSVARSLLPVEDSFVQQYAENTSSPLHKFKLKVESVYEVDSIGDKDFKAGFANHKLLWFGVSPEKVYSILREGLRSSSAIGTGTFGAGVYFTDCATKAANYTSKDTAKFSGGADSGDSKPGFDDVGYLFLAQVGLGKMLEFTKPDINAKSSLKGADSVYGRGSYRPDGEYVMRNSEPKIILPMENLKKFQDLELKHNEFILYDGQKARLRYLVRVRIQR